MIYYSEKGKITTKLEFTEFDMIGWSLLDATPVYRATVTEFSIACGVIAIYHKVINGDGSDYKLPNYRNINNSFTPCYLA